MEITDVKEKNTYLVILTAEYDDMGIGNVILATFDELKTYGWDDIKKPLAIGEVVESEDYKGAMLVRLT